MDAREADVEAVLRSAVDTYGSLDVLHNNAGVELYLPVVMVTEEQVDTLLNVNFKGVLWGCKHAMPIMAEQGHGSIVNTSSMAGISGLPAQAVYCATKAAVVVFSRVLAKELGPHGIRVNVLSPTGTTNPAINSREIVICLC